MHLKDSKIKLETFKKVWEDFHILYGRDIKKGIIAILWEEFKEWKEEEFLEVAKKVKQTCRFMPTIADFYSNKEKDPYESLPKL